MKKKKLSIRDIAEQLNISKTAVSFILNGKAKEKRISIELTERVLKHVEEKGFRPNQLAKSLSTGKTMMIGLMVEKISDYFFSKVAYHIEELAYKNGYKIIYCSTENNEHKTKELINMFRDRHIDGYIITPPAGIEDDVQELIQDNLPVVLFDRYFPETATDYVVLDNFKGSYSAVNHLIERGFSEIAFVQLDSEQTQMKDRESGYLTAMEENGLLCSILKIPFGQDSEATVSNLIAFMKKNEKKEAVLFATNYLAISGIQALNQLKMKIPDDVAVVAFDDHDIFVTYNPTITVVAQPVDEMAKALINVLLDKLENSQKKPGLQQIVISPKLICRDSTQPKLKPKKI